MVQSITLQNVADTDIVNNDILGQICFAAPNEATGTDALLVAASIFARSEGTFAADNNATELVFVTGASESAAPGATNYDMALNSTGTLSLAGGLVIADGGNIGSASDTDALTISSGGLVTFSQGFAVGSDASGDILYHNGTSYVRLAKGSDDEVLTLASGLPSWAAAGGGSARSVAGDTGNGVVTWVTGDNTFAVESTLIFDGTDLTLGNDLILDSDECAIQFGDNQEVTLTHVQDSGLTLKHTAGGDNKPLLFTLATGETTLIADEVLSKIAFQAPSEASGTDALLIAAAIQAVAEGAFNTSSNATRLEFMTGASEAATSKMSLSSAGLLTVSGIIKTDDTTDATSTTDGSLQTDGGLSVAKDCIFGNDVKLLTDSSVLSLGVGSDATFTHDGTTGITIAANPITLDSAAAINIDAGNGVINLQDSGSTVLSFTEGNSGDVTIKLVTNGKDLVFTDNGDATNMTILDAAAGINVPGEVQTTGIGYTDGDNAMTIADGGACTFPQKITASKAIQGAIVTATEDATVVIDLSTSNYFEITLGANVTDIDFTNGSVGQRFVIRFEQPAGANYTIVYSAVTHDLDGGGSPAAVTVSWPGGTAPTMTATNDKADTYGFIVRAEGHFDGYVIGQNIAETTN